MKTALFDLGEKRLSADLSQGIDLAIPLRFNGRQPRFFGTPPASCQTLQSADFLGDTRRGGSCNVEHLSLVAHCNGTHTECIGHIVDDAVNITQASFSAFEHARLISITTRLNHYQKQPVISAEELETALQRNQKGCNYPALIIRTLPNPPEKQHYDYDHEAPPAYISAEAMEALVKHGVEHLLVDVPSVDPMHDAGRLRAHRVFWNLPQGSRRLADAGPERVACTITEMIFVPEHVVDGHYLLNLQIPAFHSDAAPSRPIIYSYDEVPR